MSLMGFVVFTLNVMQMTKTSEQHATVAVCNEEKNIGETREQFNA